MSISNRNIAIAGTVVAVAGVAYEFFLSPSARASIAAAKAAGKPLGPLGARPLTSIGQSPIVPAKASAATRYTTGQPSPGAPTGGLRLGSPSGGLGAVLPGLVTGLGKLFSSFGGGDKKPSTPGGGSSSGGGMGGAPSSGGTSGRQPSGRTYDDVPSNFGAGGAAYAQASQTYADQYGQVAYQQPDGTYQDDWGNQVYVDAEGTVQYGAGEDYWMDYDADHDNVGYAAGGVVFADSDAPDSTFYGDGGPLADPDNDDGGFGADGVPWAPTDDLGGEQYDGTYDANDDPESGDWWTMPDGAFLASDQDNFTLAETGDDWADDWGGGGGDAYDTDNEWYDWE